MTEIAVREEKIEEGGKFLSRVDLEQIFPHRGIALIADYGSIIKDVYSLALKSNHFDLYTNGHNWFFPMHWLIEMAALTAGLAAIQELHRQMGPEAHEFNIPSFHQPGSWAGEQLSPDLSSSNPIEAHCHTDDLILRIGKIRVRVEASIKMEQDGRTAILSGIKGTIIKGDFFERKK